MQPSLISSYVNDGAAILSMENTKTNDNMMAWSIITASVEMGKAVVINACNKFSHLLKELQ